MQLPSLKVGESAVLDLGGRKIKVTAVRSVPATAQTIYDSSNLPPLKKCKHFGSITPERFPPPEGLGDLAADAFASLGLTKERWTKLVGMFDSKRKEGQEDCTGCNRRHKLWNWAGKKLGLSEGQGPELQKLIQLEKIEDGPVYSCALHGKCITHQPFHGEARDIVTATGFAPCSGCPDQDLVEIPRRMVSNEQFAQITKPNQQPPQASEV